jgi:2,4-dienoyl-CoA reductase-like NADH-dependent reductase (Old Yellow Enzyme family)
MNDHATPLLLSPYALRGVTLRNRVVVSPMSQYRSEPGGVVGDWHLVHLGKFAVGGAGMVFCEETSVSERSRKTYDCPGIYTDAQARAWRRVTDFLRANGAVPAMQIGHAGRKVATRAPWDGFAPLGPEDAARGRAPWSGLAPSPIPFKEGATLPKEMDSDDIRAVIALHVEAAKRSLDAGFDVLEVHAAHGYIIQQFLSPATNRRTDGYGGDRAGRMRFGLELVEAVRAALPDETPLLVRVSCVDGGGWTLPDTLALAAGFKARGVDLLDCSSGGIEGPLTLHLVPRVPGYHVPFAEAVLRQTGLPTMAVGLITEARQAEGYLRAGACHLVALAREMMWNPNWPIHAAAELGADPLAFMPDSYAWWLKRRFEARKLYPTGLEAAE